MTRKHKTVIGRMSSSKPNMQNYPKPAGSDAPIELEVGDRVEVLWGWRLHTDRDRPPRGSVMQVFVDNDQGLPGVVSICVLMDGKAKPTTYRRAQLRRLTGVEVLAEEGGAH